MILVPVALLICVAVLTSRRRHQSRPRSGLILPALCGAALAGATGVGYLLLIERQGPPYDLARVSLVATLIFAAALAAGIASMTHRASVTRGLLIGASVGLWMLGMVGLASVGLPLLVAGSLNLPWGSSFAAERVATPERPFWSARAPARNDGSTSALPPDSKGSVSRARVPAIRDRSRAGVQPSFGGSLLSGDTEWLSRAQAVAQTLSAVAIHPARALG